LPQMRVIRHYPAAPPVMRREDPLMNRRQSPRALHGLVFVASLAAAGILAAPMARAQQPAPAPDVAAEDNGDPWESTNRAIFSFNQGVDEHVLVPVSKAYRVLPQPARDVVHDFLQNLNGPIIFANDVLQGQVGLASDTLGRFVVNSTLGLAGIVDVATKAGIPYHTNDMGITLATWGVASGPYVMLPVLGPSNPRDLFGDVADGFGDPGNIVASNYGRLWASILRGAASGIDERSRNIESLDEIERTSLDFYATIRSLARQRRAAQIRHQKEDVPNATPLQGASARQVPEPPQTLAVLPKQPAAPITYSLPPQPASLEDLQRSPMAAPAAPSTTSRR
jgi:phospholipid-binding lipoprotein MlaA